MAGIADPSSLGILVIESERLAGVLRLLRLPTWLVAARSPPRDVPAGARARDLVRRRPPPPAVLDVPRGGPTSTRVGSEMFNAWSLWFTGTAAYRERVRVGVREDPSRRRRARSPVVIVAALLGMVVLCVSVLWSVQRHLIYLPRGSPAGTAVGDVPGAREVILTTVDGLQLAAWHVPPAAGRPTVLVAGGNAGHRGLRAPLAAALVRHGLGVLLFDYRGYAGNPGHPSEAGLARDVRAARSFLMERAGVSPGDLLYFGESLGSAVVAELAAEHPPAGLVLRSPFTSLADVGRVHYPLLPVRALLRERYPLAETLATVQVPTVVILGTRDTVVPPEQSRAVARAAAGPTRVVEVEGADHNDAALLAGDQLVGAVVALARQVSDGRG